MRLFYFPRLYCRNPPFEESCSSLNHERSAIARKGVRSRLQSNSCYNAVNGWILITGFKFTSDGIATADTLIQLTALSSSYLLSFFYWRARVLISVMFHDQLRQSHQNKFPFRKQSLLLKVVIPKRENPQFQNQTWIFHILTSLPNYFNIKLSSISDSSMIGDPCPLTL